MDSDQAKVYPSLSYIEEIHIEELSSKRFSSFNNPCGNKLHIPDFKIVLRDLVEGFAAASLFHVSKAKRKKTRAFQACHAQSGEGIFYFLGYEMQ